jgi:hypothetical protein
MRWWNIGKDTSGYAGEEFNPQILECPYCGCKGRFTREFRQKRESQRLHQGLTWDVYKCVECGNLTFVAWRRVFEGFQNRYDFDSAPFKRGDIAAPKELPAMVATAYVEACKNIKSEAWNSAAAMARRAVQAATRERGAQGGSLYEEIKYLGAQGLLTKDLMDWAHEVRGIGNAGAHPDEIGGDVTEADARDAVNFAIYFLTYVYTVPAEIERARAAKAGKKS